MGLQRVRTDNFRADFVRHVRRQLRLPGFSRADDKECALHSIRSNLSA